MVISLLCVVCGSIMAFMGTLINIIKEQYSVEGLETWNVVFYIMAGILALVAVIEFIHSLMRLHRRRQRIKDEDDLFDITIKHTSLNGTYPGGNGKKRTKNVSKPSNDKKRVI